MYSPTVHHHYLVFFIAVDINEFYTYTLEDTSKPVEIKTVATYELAEKWEGVSPPVPTVTVELAKKILDNEVGSVFSKLFEWWGV